MEELVINLHMHTTYSDGSGTHAELGQAALKTGVDVLLVTDHNILVQGWTPTIKAGKKRALLLACEEIHDQDRDPQKNHLLVFGASQELATLADDPQNLINAVRRQGGLSFIAHPVDPAMPAFGETDISWEDWGVTGFTGIELWNGFSELKTVAKGKLDAIYYAFSATGSYRTVHCQRRSRSGMNLLNKGRRVVAVGGSDAHARHMAWDCYIKPFFLMNTTFRRLTRIHSHLNSLSGNLAQDRKMVFDALAAGHCFVGYDLPAPTRGFRFSAQRAGQRNHGGRNYEGAVTLQAKFPSSADIKLIKDGKCIKTLHGDTFMHVTDEAGVYRVEAYKQFLGKLRGWIFSNPIYVR